MLAICGIYTFFGRLLVIYQGSVADGDIEEMELKKIRERCVPNPDGMEKKAASMM